MTRSPGLALDPESHEPLYRQLFDQVVERIQARALPEGHRLPPTRDLAREMRTNRNTVVRAYAELERAGFVTSTVGRGTFVASLREAPRAEVPAPSGAVPWQALFSRAMGGEPLARAERFVARATAAGVINLTRMQPSPELVPHELFRRCIDHVLRTQGSRALAYAPPAGLPRLRALIADDLVRQGVPATADDILVTTGSQQALDLLARALVDPGDPFLVDTTTYGGALNLFTLAGARLIAVPSDGEGPDMGTLERLSRSGAKGLYLMPNAHNPTAATISTERRKALVTWARRAGIPILEDDYSADSSFAPEGPPPPLRALDGDVVHIGTFSKRLIPALRVGFIVCPKAVRPALSALKHAMDLGTSAMVQHALAEFLDRGYLRAHLHRTLPEYRARRDALGKSLRQHLPRGLSFREPQHGLVLWLPLPKSLDAEAVFEEARRRGVLVSPSSLQAVDGQAENGLRLTFCAEPIDRLTLGGRRLGEALAALSGPPKKRGRGQEDQGRLEAV